MNVYFKTIVGSKLYGLDTPTSDTDYKGFGMPDCDYIIGLKRQETDSCKNLTENSEEALFSVGKYLSVLMKGNPTVFEIAFADKKFHTVRTPIGSAIISFVQKTFITKHLFSPYSAYFRAQRADIKKQKTKGNRIEIIKQFGYDTKSASHCLRIGYQCNQIMKTGYLNPTLEGEEREICMAIKKGEMNLSQVDSILEKVDKEMYNSYKNTKLTEQPDYQTVNEFCVSIYKNYLLGLSF